MFLGEKKIKKKPDLRQTGATQCANFPLSA
jgi:hypothetical protein